MITLRGITWEHPRGYDSVIGATADWGGLPPDTVRVEWSARSLQHFADQTLDQLAQQYDLLVIDHPHIPEAHDHGVLLALDGRGRDDTLATLAADTIGPSHSSYSYAGHQYGLAIDAAAQVSVHRPDLLTEVPTAWDEVHELGRRQRLLWAAKPVDAVSSFITLAANAGHPVAAPPGQLLDRQTGLATLDRLHRLTEVVPSWCLDANPIDVAEALATSDEWLYSPLAFGYINYSRIGYRPNRLAYRDMPGGLAGVSGSCLGGAGIAVSAASAHQKQAVDFAFWLASPDVQAGVYYCSGGQPASAHAWDKEELNVECLQFFQGTRATLEGAYVRPRYARWLEVFDEVGRLVNDALRFPGDDESVLDAAQAVYERSLSTQGDGHR
jgi:multiple sugar transport system substrate-binding protein